MIPEDAYYVPSTSRERIRNVPLAHVVGLLILAAGLTYCSLETLAAPGNVANASLGPFPTILARFVVLLVVLMTIWTWGRAIRRLLPLSESLRHSLPVTLIGGWLVLSTSLMIGRFLLPIGMFLLFVIHAIVGWVLWVRGSDREGYADFEWSAHKLPGLDAILLATLAGVLWTAHYLPPMTDEDGVVVFQMIRDKFILADCVSLLAHGPTAQWLGRIGLAGEPVPLYHYTSFSIPAVFVAAGVDTSYGTMASIVVPLGLIMVGLGAYTLASAWFGPTVGLWGTAAVLVLPDPTVWSGAWETRSANYYAFDRFLQFAPANSYALAALALVLASVTSSPSARSGWIRLVPLALLGMTLFVKAQLFVAAAPLILGIFLWRLIRDQGGIGPSARQAFAQPATWGALVLLALAGVFLAPLFAGRVPILRLELPPGQGLIQFFVKITSQEPILHGISCWGADHEGVGGFLARLLLVGWLPLRWLFPLVVLWWCSRAWGRRLDMPDVVTAAVLVLYCGYALLLAPNTVEGQPFGHPWDLLHVPFAWAYLVALVWLAGRINSWEFPGARLMAFALLVFPWALGSLPYRDFVADSYWVFLPLPRDLVDAAEIIRLRTHGDELLQDSMDDPFYAVEALSERRPYVGWSVVGTYTARDPMHSVFETRTQWHQALRRCRRPDEIRKLAREAGIVWYLLHPETEVDWDPDVLARPVVTFGRYKLYDLRLPDES